VRCGESAGIDRVRLHDAAAVQGRPAGPTPSGRRRAGPGARL